MDNPAVSFSMLNSLRTGNPVVDMALAMLVPGLITAVMAYLNSSVRPLLYDLYLRFFVGTDERIITRRIEFESSSDRYREVNNERDKRNNILQKALQMYIGEHTASVKLKIANVSLLAAKEKGMRDSNTWEVRGILEFWINPTCPCLCFDTKTNAVLRRLNYLSLDAIREYSGAAEGVLVSPTQPAHNPRTSPTIC